MDDRTPWLVCCGLVTLDVLQVVDHVPAADEKLVAHGLDVTFGGPAANAAATAVALGVPTRLVTAIGSGPVADLVRAGLEGAGVDVVDLLAGEQASPAVSTVLVTRATGERAVVSVNASGVRDLGAPARTRAAALLDGAGAVLLDGHHLGAALVVAQASRERGVPVALDGGSWKDGLEDVLALVDHAVLSADFRLPAEHVRRDHRGAGGERPAPGTRADLLAVAALGPRTVARSAGPGPLHWLDVTSDGPVHTVHPPAVQPEDVIDTLGAGDVLHGAFAAELTRGAAVLEALATAADIATLSVRHPGARGWTLTPLPPR